jgi:DNA repair exonuclease SbcCD ATPase subunit
LKIENLEQDLELRLRVDIHELEERKNLHINNLTKTFEDRMDAWKKENIQQIKENINLIKQNSENFKLLKDDNEKLEKEVEDLRKEIIELDKIYENAKQEHSQITNRLAKYYNQDINFENMTLKVNSLMKKCEDTIKKTKDAGAKKEILISEIKDLKARFEGAVSQFKERAEFKNNLLDEHIKQLDDNYTKREIEIEEILKEVDNVASMDSSSSFGRQMVLELLNNIRHVLFNKTQIIKNLKYSLALATKVKL